MLNYLRKRNAISFNAQKLKAMKEQLNTKIAANEVKITELREKDANEENRERLPGGSNVARHHQKLNLQAEAELEEAKRSILEVQNAIADKLGGNEQDVPCPPRRLEFIRPVALSSDAALALQPASSSALGLAGLAPAALATAIRSGVVSSIAQRYAAKPDADAAVLEDLFVQLVRLTAAAADPGTSSAAARTAHALLQSLPDGSRTLSAACFLEALETLGFSGRAGGGAAAPSTSAGSAPSTAQVQALGRIVQLIGAAAAQPCSWLAIDGMSSQRLCAALACLLIDAAGLSIHPDVAAACGHVLALVGAASPGAMETAATELVAAVNGNYIALQQIVDRLPVTGGAAGDALRARVTLLGVRGLLEGKGFGGAVSHRFFSLEGSRDTAFALLS